MIIAGFMERHVPIPATDQTQIIMAYQARSLPVLVPLLLVLLDTAHTASDTSHRERQHAAVDMLPSLQEPPPMLVQPVALLRRTGAQPLRCVRNTLRSDALRHLLAGAAAGAVSNTIVAPLDILRINLMCAKDQTNALRVARRIFCEKGMLGFWQGNSADVLRTMPSSAIRFYTFALYKVPPHPSRTASPRACSLTAHAQPRRTRAPPMAAALPSGRPHAERRLPLRRRCYLRRLMRWASLAQQSRRSLRAASQASPRWRRSFR